MSGVICSHPRRCDRQAVGTSGGDAHPELWCQHHVDRVQRAVEEYEFARLVVSFEHEERRAARPR
jgi:hypothetical protein